MEELLILSTEYTIADKEIFYPKHEVKRWYTTYSTWLPENVG